jgi:hypothetical protein
MDTSNAQKSPWFLVKDPVSLTGYISSSLPGIDENPNQDTDAVIDIQIKVAKSPMPAALDRLLTNLSEVLKEENVKY